MKNIAVLDSSTITLKNVKNLLEKNQYAVSPTDSPREFFQMIQSSNFDLFIMNYQLKECTTLDILPLVRRIPNYINTPVILISGGIDIDILQNLLPFGISDFLIKPLKIDSLLEKIKKALC